MEKSETIVADLTCGLGNRPHASSGDNVLASVSWGHAGGLANSRAVTSRNHCSVVIATTRTWFKWSSWRAEPFTSRSRQYPRASSDTCTRGALRRRDDGKTVNVTEMQSGEVPCSISVFSGMRDANTGDVWECGMAHGVVVAVKPMITSGISEGPLGFRGCGMREGLGYCPNGLQDLKAKPSHANYNEAYGKPVGGKAVGDGYTRKLETGIGESDLPGF